jgi:ribonucleotide reductase alpha subunit
VWQHLLTDLMARGLWTDDIRNQIIAHNGSVQSIPEIPADLKTLYRTCWEMKMRSLIDMVRSASATAPVLLRHRVRPLPRAGVVAVLW